MASIRCDSDGDQVRPSGLEAIVAVGSLFLRVDLTLILNRDAIFSLRESTQAARG
jgi:hypothetical protein